MGLFTFAKLMTAGIQQTFILKIAPEYMQGQYFAAASLRYTIGRTIAPIAIPMSLWFGYTIICDSSCFSSIKRRTLLCDVSES
jgi:hypothetical protein